MWKKKHLLCSDLVQHRFQSDTDYHHFFLFYSIRSDYDMRTTKLALVRAQLRRQCFQARQSYRANLSVCRQNNDSTSTLIQAAKDGAHGAVSTLNEINGKQPKPVDR